jgi:TatD DNase family protein
LADPAGAWAAARALGLRGLVIPGIDGAQGARAAAWCALPGVYRALGLHPWAVDALPDDGAVESALAAVFAAAEAGPAPVAVGETGLDLVRVRRGASLPRQEAAFRASLAWARARDLPVILHLVGDPQPALRLLARDGLPAAGGVVHAFAGGPEVARALLEGGLHLGVGGALTHHPTGRLARAVALAPPERLLVETDAPDQPVAGVPPRGGTPLDLPAVIAAVAAARGEDPAAVAGYTAANARRLYRVEPPP